MQPRVVKRGWKCETKSDEVHVFFSFFIFTELDTAQPRRRRCVQSILFNIFRELARRLIPPSSAKTTLSPACLPNEQRMTLAGAARSTLNIQHRMPNGRGWGSATGGYRFFLASWFPDFYDL